MRKGLLYLLPIMALTQMGASMPDLRADHHPNNQKTIAEDGRKDATSGIVDGAEKGPRRIAGRNGFGHHNSLEIPRAGRNVTRMPGGRALVPRN